ncbi:MAG: two-component system response regulator [Micrococcales bacterium 70-64]|nr:response regulator transcription factor [Leifsonia sp.]ODU65151.1 MAG: two-component system response regulator [Leifsonia sp. SCN 70-46]OJX86843.1 MAG: two-component system response regulator [Micrococcales bacterium 70-64]
MSDNTETRRVAVVIEDDADIRHLLDTVLTQAGFQVITAGNGLDGIQAVRNYEPLVTTLDVNMPGMDGFETARRIRDFSSTYLIMLTALGEEIDALQGLDAGADDYILKPFRPRELRARVEAMLRRPRALAADAPAAPAPVPAPAPVEAPFPAVFTAPVATVPPAAVPEPPAPAPVVTAPPAAAAPPAPAPVAEQDDDGWLEHNGLWVNPGTRVVQQDGVELDLTRSEFDLLAGLMRTTRRVRTKADLVLLLRGESYVTSHFVSDADKRAIEVHMANLRKKLGENPSEPRWIETVRGVGYRLTAADPT